MHIAFPFHVDPTGRTATVDHRTHVRELIEVTLFTEPGERVNRPDFGCGLLQLVFSGQSTSTVTALSAIVQGALQRSLHEVVDIRDVDVQLDESTLTATIQFRDRATGLVDILHVERVL